MKISLFRWRSLKTRVTVFTLGIFLLGMAALAYFASSMLRQDLQRVLGDQQRHHASAAAANISRELIHRTQALEMVAKDITAAMLGDLPALQAHMQRLPVFLALFNSSVVAYQADGTALAEVPRASARVGHKEADRDGLMGALQGRPSIGPPQPSRSGQEAEFLISVPVHGPAGEVIGALAGITNLSQTNFLDRYTGQRYGASGSYALLSAAQRLTITATDKRSLLAPLPAPGVMPRLDAFLQGQEGVVVMQDVQGQSVLAAYAHIPAANWVLAVLLPTAEAFAPIHRLQQRMLIVALTLALLAGVLTWWLLKRELSPMLSAVHTLAALAGSDQPPQPLPIARRDEVGKLIGSFNQLLAKLLAAQQELRIAATAFESHQGMTIANAQGEILRVNQAFTHITGYDADEVVGKNPRILSSGRHDANFYKAMWAQIALTGTWQGEIWNRRKDGKVYPEWLSISAVNSAAGQTTHYVATFSDITVRKNAEEKINNLAFYDPLTQLPNRRLLLNRLEQALVSCARRGCKGALLYVDLDNFKTLNETLGHVQGDLLLEMVGTRLSTCVREGDTVARIGGDEFAVMLADLSDNAVEAATQAESVATKINVALCKRYPIGPFEHLSTSSIGITLFGGATTEAHEAMDEPLKRAELAMYQAKAAGRNTMRFFETQMQVVVAERAALEADLHDAVHQHQFVLHYQAQVVGAGRLMGAEVLVRWQHPRRGLVSPFDFIPLAEETGLILPLGQWVLEAACGQLATWAAQPDMAHLTLAVNVSAKQFQQADFVDQVLATLARTGASPKRLKLELTESLLVENVEGIIVKMAMLKTHGVGFSLDDFGTGYSSLSYLKRLPLDQLKIDQSFVRNILTDTNDAAIAKMVVALAESMGLAVIAEGVEMDAQKEFLAHLGCHAYQGYLFSRPIPLAAFEAFARNASIA